MSNGTGWKEEYLNENGMMLDGSYDKEQLYFKELSEMIIKVVKHYASDNGHPMRGNHAKILAGFTKAEFRIYPDIPHDLSIGLLKPGKTYKTIVRFSNASGEVKSDDKKSDLRGVALRVITDKHDHDFLMTNANIHHAKDAREAMMTIMAGLSKDTAEDFFSLNKILSTNAGKLAFFFSLKTSLGKEAAERITKTLKLQMGHEIKSLISESYFSRAPIAIGEVSSPEKSVAVKFRLEPTVDTLTKLEGGKEDKFKGIVDLGSDIKNFISQYDVKFLFQVQRYVNSIETPIEDATIPWPDNWETVAELVIPHGTRPDDKLVDGLAFNPWNVDLYYFQPLGSMNRSRRVVYPASASIEKRPLK